jgi:hypothetical protein
MRVRTNRTIMVDLSASIYNDANAADGRYVNYCADSYKASITNRGIARNVGARMYQRNDLKIAPNQIPMNSCTYDRVGYRQMKAMACGSLLSKPIVCANDLCIKNRGTNRQAGIKYACNSDVVEEGIFKSNFVMGATADEDQGFQSDESH